MTTFDYSEQLQHIEQTGIVVMREITGFKAYNTDYISPYLTLLYCHRGSARASYNLQESTHCQNELACIMPGHILHPIESSDDYLVTIIVVSQRLYEELPSYTFSHDYDKFNYSPFCTLSDTQAQRLLTIAEQLETIASHSDTELPHRTNMMLALLAVGYECLNFYRQEQDRQWDQQTHLLNEFCDLVVAHYKESREVKYYAKLLHLSPKYFSKVISSLTGGQSPADWIEQYVAAQAKHMLLTQQKTVKETAYCLGFSESASFCRFFKRVTGLTPQLFRERH